MYEDYIKPIIDRIKNNAYVKTLTTIVFYYFLSIFASLLFLNVTDNMFTPLNYALMYITVIFFFVKNHHFVFKNFKTFVSDVKENYKSLILVFIIGTVATLLVVAAYTFGFNVYSNNELEVESLIKNYTLQIVPVLIILAPIAEELTYRAILTDITKHKIPCTIISTILFGLVHVLSAANIFNGIIYLIPYTMIGLTFAYGTLKTNNTLVSMIMHIAYNLINFVILLCI